MPLKIKSRQVEMVHVGLHKTGTSWLQFELFPKLPVNIISNELLSGRPMRLTIDDIIDTNERYHYAKEIKYKYGDVKILLGIRNKPELMNSLYSQYLKGGGTMIWSIWKHTYLNWSYLNYEAYIQYLSNKFSDVKVYRYEDFRDRKEQFVKELCDWLGCDVPKYSDYPVNKGLTTKQKLNYLWKSNIRNMKFYLRGLMNDNRPSDWS